MPDHLVTAKRIPGGWAAFLCRKRYVDDQLVNAVTEGIDAVVILGAGYDTRAYRLPELAGIPVCEVDLPGNVARKAAALRTYIPKCVSWTVATSLRTHPSTRGQFSDDADTAHFPGVCDCSLMCGHAGYAGTTGHLRTPTNGPAEHGGDMDLGLAERTALVCASTSGLGLATARALCEDGARVVVTSRSSERAEEVAAALPYAIGIGCDLLAADGAARLFGESTKRVGKIDILVLNGPGPAPGTAADVDDAGVDSAVAALVKPQVQLVRSVLPAMQAQRWGRILSISSTSIVAPIANLALSNLSRAALAGYLKSLANEVAAQGITVNSLLPGRIATPRARQINEAAAARSGIPVADVEQSSTGEIPAGRYGEPDEFGAVAAFLCSARASYVTGAALRCDGGLVPTL